MAQLKRRVNRGNKKDRIESLMWTFTAKCIPCKQMFQWNQRNRSTKSIYVCQKCGGEMKTANKLVMSYAEAKAIVDGKKPKTEPEVQPEVKAT